MGRTNPEEKGRDRSVRVLSPRHNVAAPLTADSGIRSPLLSRQTPPGESRVKWEMTGYPRRRRIYLPRCARFCDESAGSDCHSSYGGVAVASSGVPELILLILCLFNLSRQAKVTFGY